MKSTRRIERLWAFPLAVALLALTAAGASAASSFAVPPDGTGGDSNLASISVTTSGLDGGCPGSAGTLTLVITSGPNAQYNSQQISVYGQILAASDDAVCGSSMFEDCSANGNDAAPAWWVIEKGTVASVDGVGTASVDACTDSCSCATPNTWPNNGGWDSPTADKFTASGQVMTATFAVEVPAQALVGVTYYLNLGVNFGNYQNNSGASEGYACIPFTVGTTPTCAAPSSVTLNKTLDSALVSGKDSLYFIDYSFVGTGSSNYVQDVIPACLTIVDESPDPSGAAATVSGNTVTWEVQPAATGATASGELYVEVLDSSCATGASVCNTAYASTTGPTGGFTTASPQVCVTAGSPLTLVKQQYNSAFGLLANGSILPPGATVNYVLTYNYSGLQLECFDGFKNDTAGTSVTEPGTASGASTTPGPDYPGIGNGQWVNPTGNTACPAGSTTWDIENSPSPDSGNYLYFPEVANSGIPAGAGDSGIYAELLDTCPAMGIPASEVACSASVVGGSSFCGGTVITDVNLEDALGNGGEIDAENIGVVLRADDNPSDADFGDQYLVTLSANDDSTACLSGYTAANNPSAQGVGHLFVQKVIAHGAGFGGTAAACNGTAGTNLGTVAQSDEPGVGNLTMGSWYTVEVTEVPSAGCSCVWGPCSDTIYAKYWPVGGAEPTGWMVTFTDNEAFGCEGTWLPGVQADADVESWTNYRVYAGSNLDNASLWDTVPAGVTYVSSSPVQQGNAVKAQWNFTANLNGAVNGLLSPGSGAFTWTGTVACSAGSTLTNTASMGAANLTSAAVSNQTSLGLSCGSATNTPTGTATASATPVFGTATYSPTPTASATPVLGTATYSPTPTASGTPVLGTATYSPTATASATPVLGTATYSSTATASATPVFGTATYSPTPTASPTRTSTPSYGATFPAPPDASGDLASISVTAGGLTNACAGSVGTLTLVFTSGTNVQYDRQQISVYGEILSAADDGACNGFLQACAPNGSDADPAWWVIEKSTAAVVDGVGTAATDACTDTCACAGANTWPNNGGWDSPSADDFTTGGQVMTVTFDVEVPAQALAGVTYYLELGVNYGNYQNSTGASEGYVCVPVSVGTLPCPHAALSPTPTPTVAADLAGCRRGTLSAYPNLIRDSGGESQITVFSCKGGRATVNILRSSGRLLKELWQGTLQPQQSVSFAWDGRDGEGNPAASGVYYVVFSDDDGTHNPKSLDHPVTEGAGMQEAKGAGGSRRPWLRFDGPGRKTFVLACLLLFCAGALSAADSGADFLLLEPAANAAGMAGAASAAGGQLDALRYNPAGLAGLGSLDLALSQMSAASDWSNSWAALGGTVAGLSLGGELLVSNLTPFTLYNAQGQAYDTAVVGSQNLGLGAALPLLKWLYAGADIRYFHSQLYTYTSQGFAVDAGIQVRDPAWPLSAGLAVQNLGSDSAYISQADPLPSLLRMGLQADFDVYQHYHVSPRVDLVNYQDSSRLAEMRLGVEVTMYEKAFVRAGWIETAGYEQATLGLGVEWQDLALDYSYQPGNVLGDTQWVELRLRRP